MARTVSPHKKNTKRVSLEQKIERTIRWFIKFTFILSILFLRISYHLLRDFTILAIQCTKKIYTVLASQDYSKISLFLRKHFPLKRKAIKEPQPIEQPLIIEVQTTKYNHLKVVK